VRPTQAIAAAAAVAPSEMTHPVAREVSRWASGGKWSRRPWTARSIRSAEVKKVSTPKMAIQKAMAGSERTRFRLAIGFILQN
jgi:hypothetical protein